MMKKVLYLFLATVIISVARYPGRVAKAQDADVNSAAVASFKAGGTPIALPSPMKDMNEVGYDNREFMEIFVPPDNRLLAAFVLAKDLPNLIKGSEDTTLSRYALVEVPRQGEYMDCGPSDFNEVIAGAKEQFGDVINSSFKDAEEEFNRRMKSLNLDDAAVSFSEPIQLGCLFSKPDAYGLGMVISIASGGKNIKMAMGMTLMRVKQRLIFVYLYTEYKDEETAKWLRKTTEDWADAILKANSKQS